MKTALIFIFTVCLSLATAVCQEQMVGVVHLKDGTVYRGTIVSRSATGTIELKVGPNNVLVFERDEIRRLDSEHIGMSTDSLNRYGKKVGLGFALGGGGILGVPLRIRLGSQTAWELSPYIRPFIVKYPNSSDVTLSLMLASAIHLGMKRRYNANKRKIIAHGFFVRGGKSFGKFKQTLLGVGWASERFKASNRAQSFIHELGPGIIINDWYDKNDPNQYYTYKDVKKISLALIWKIHISSALKQ